MKILRQQRNLNFFFFFGKGFLFTHVLAMVADILTDYTPIENTTGQAEVTYQPQCPIQNRKLGHALNKFWVQITELPSLLQPS